MLSYRFGTANDFHWGGGKLVLIHSKHHTFFTFIGGEK